MRSSVRKIGVLILLVLVMPVLAISLFEVGNLRQNEMVIQDIYRNQLDAILFSINQYSDDLMGNLAGRIENTLSRYRKDAEPELARLIGEIPSVKGLITLDQQYNYISAIPESCCDSAKLSGIRLEIFRNDSTIRRLQTYLRGGYRKIEPLDNPDRDARNIVFLTQAEELMRVHILVLDPAAFISQVLDPKIQEITRGKFQIAAFRAGEDKPFYTSNKQGVSGNIEEKRTFWLLKDYQMGIELKELTIADLSKDRSKRNLLFIGMIDMLLLLGAWIIFRNIARQVELSQLKSEFVSSVSHEIRTPLALISMYVETLEMGRVSSADKVKEYYAVILNETTRLSGMVNRILSFSQIESNKRKYSFGDSDLNEIVENSALTFRYTIDNKGFTYLFEPDRSLPVIQADREAIADAFVNLIDNAMKYSGDIKSIVVRTGKTDGHIYLEVEDKGIGISERDQKYIFDKFYRVTEKNLASRVKGSGLGLSIVKHIMEAHGGKIYVKSSLGNGSLFRLLFPVRKKVSL